MLIHTVGSVFIIVDKLLLPSASYYIDEGVDCRNQFSPKIREDKVQRLYCVRSGRRSEVE